MAMLNYQRVNQELVQQFLDMFTLKHMLNIVEAVIVGGFAVHSIVKSARKLLATLILGSNVVLHTLR